MYIHTVFCPSKPRIRLSKRIRISSWRRHGKCRKSNLICRQLIFEFFHLALCVMNYAFSSVDCLHSILLQTAASWAASFSSNRQFAKCNNVQSSMSRPHRCHAFVCCVCCSLDTHESAHKRHVIQFNRFCTAYLCVQHTDHATRNMNRNRPHLCTACRQCRLNSKHT